MLAVWKPFKSENKNVLILILVTFHMSMSDDIPPSPLPPPLAPTPNSAGCCLSGDGVPDAYWAGSGLQGTEITSCMVVG